MGTQTIVREEIIRVPTIRQVNEETETTEDPGTDYLTKGPTLKSNTYIIKDKRYTLSRLQYKRLDNMDIRFKILNSYGSPSSLLIT